MSFVLGTNPPSAYFCCDRFVLRWPSETYELITCDLQPIWEKEKTYATHWFCAITPFIHVIFTGVSCRHACTVAHQQSKNKMHTRKAIEHDEIGWETLWRLIIEWSTAAPLPPLVSSTGIPFFCLEFIERSGTKNNKSIREESKRERNLYWWYSELSH